MRWRPGHLLFLAFQFLWLNIVIPGHTRGVIPLPGMACESHAAKSCCHESKPQPATPEKPHACAICYFAATLSTPPAIVCSPPPLLPVAFVEGQRVESLIAREALLPFYSCGPPAFARQAV